MSADDADLASKPAPDGLLHIARTLGVAADRLAMVGDTATDMRAGRSAGVGLVVGVLSGLATLTISRRLLTPSYQTFMP